MKFIHKIFLVLFVLTQSCNEAKVKDPVPETQALPEIENIKLTDLQGNAMKLSQYAGKTIFLNFWATWCKPCVMEMPSINNAKKLFSEEEVVFLFASNESVEEIENFKNNNLFDFNYFRMENMEQMNIQALPTTFIFNPKGEKVFAEIGFRQWDDSANIELIQKIINQK